MTRLANHEFLAEVGKLLAANDGKNSVYVTQKRLVLDVEAPGHLADLPSNVVTLEMEPLAPVNVTTYPILVRVQMNGKERKDKLTKLLTVVETSQLEQFWGDYVQVLKNGMVGLRKREKKKKKNKNKNKVTK